MRVPQVSERIKEAPAQALRVVFAGIGQLLLITDRLRNKTPAGQDVPRARMPEAERVTDKTAADPAGPREEATAPGEGATATATATVGASAAAEAGAAEAVTAVAAESAPAAPAAARHAPAKPVTPKPPTARRAPAKPGAAKPASARRAAAKPSAAEPGAAEPPGPPKRQSARDFDKTGNVRVLGGAEDAAVEPAAAPEPVAAPEPAVAPEPVIPEPVSAAAAQPASSAAAAEPASGAADSGAPLPNYDELSVASLRARLRNLDAARVGQLADYERAHAARADVLAMYERRIAKLEAEA